MMSYSKTFGGKMTRPLTVKEAAGQMGYHPDHLRRLLRKGTVKGESFSGVWMIDPAEVEGVKGLQGKGGRLPKVPKQ
jgi:hypothetical protein